MKIETYTCKNGGFVSIWECQNKIGRATSQISAEQAEKNAVKQAKRQGCRMTDYCNNAQSPTIIRNLDKAVD